MLISIMAVYLAVGASVFVGWSWLYRQGLRNLFRDFTWSSAMAIVGLLALLLIPIWPLLLLAWRQSQTPAFQQHYHEIEELRRLGKYEEIVEALRTRHPV
jgi:cell division protein FtsX